MSNRSEILEEAAVALEGLWERTQGHTPNELYEDGYADAISEAASLVRLLKLREYCYPWQPNLRNP